MIDAEDWVTDAILWEMGWCRPRDRRTLDEVGQKPNDRSKGIMTITAVLTYPQMTRL